MPSPSIKTKKPNVIFTVNMSDGGSRRALEGCLKYTNLFAPWTFSIAPEDTLSAKTFTQCDGIYADITGPKPIKKLYRVLEKHSHIHCVTLQPHAESDRTSLVSSDDFQIGMMACDYFVNKGFQSIAFYPDSIPLSPASQMRWKGYQKAASRLNLETSLFSSKTLRNDKVGSSRKLLEWVQTLARPCGLLVNHATLAFYVIRTLVEHGVSVPHDIAILTVGDDSLICESASPSLSHIDPNYFQIGFNAAKTLHDLLLKCTTSTQPARPSQRIAPIGIAERPSTDTIATQDASLNRAITLIRERACLPECNVDYIIKKIGSTNRRTLERKFQQALNLTPKKMISHERLQRAKYLIQHTNWTLERIAPACGYPLPHHLIRIFKQTYNETPTEYRKRVGNQRQAGPS